MKINKAQFNFDGGNVDISVPFQKVNKESRTVSGFATLNNVDRHDDIVTQEASMKAFSNFRGNVREMHQPIAVGRVIDVTPETFYDGENDEFYSGIYVTARISQGAQDTWEKVLDGTLSGFSIGGRVIDAETQWDNNLKKNIQIINDMELFELSLVDNPANPLANIVSIQKVHGDAPEQDVTEHVYTCSTCKVVISSQADERACPSCDGAMKDIGFMVAIGRNEEDVKKEINKMLDAHKTSVADEAAEHNDPLTEADTISEGDISMENNEIQSDAEDTVVDEVIEKAADEEMAPEASEDVSATEEIADAGVEEESAAEVTEPEVQVEETVVAEADAFAEITAALADLKTFVSDVLSTHASDIKAAQEATAAVSKSVEAMGENITTALTEIKEVKGSVENIVKSVDELEDATAVQKSGSLGGETAAIQKSIWGGTFLNVSDIENKEGR